MTVFKRSLAAKCFTICSLYFSLAAAALPALRDIEANLSDFVVETKQIVIPGYPDAFNPSITRWKDSLLMIFRYRDEDSSSDPMAFVWLDDDFNIVGDPIRLVRLFEPCNPPSRGQDPRLVTIDDDLYIVYNNFVDVDDSKSWHLFHTRDYTDLENRRMYIAKVHNLGLAFFTTHYDVIKSFPGEDPHRKEKNWVPFVHDKTLLLAYSLNPHQIMLPASDGSHSAATVCSTQKSINWKWGPLLGGTNAIKVGNKYLAFFHSVKSLETVQSGGKSIPHYFMGAYLFDEEQPFELTHISPKPIIGPNFYNGKEHRTWKPLRVVFPGGVVADEDYVWVVYGRQDHESWVVKMDKNKLFESLIELHD